MQGGMIKKPNEIIGYRIYYNRKDTIQIPVEDTVSQGKYGPGLVEVTEQFPDSRWAIAYMEKMLATTKDPQKQGDCTVVLWNEGTREYQDNPMPGDIVDFVTPRDTYPDCYVQDVEYSFTQNGGYCTLSTRKMPAGQGVINEIQKIKNFWLRFKQKTQQNTMKLWRLQKQSLLLKQAVRFTIGKCTTFGMVERQGSLNGNKHI